MKTILKISNLNIDFTMCDNRFKTHRIKIINDLSLDLREGELLTIVGSSGSGKSIFASALLNILPSNANVDGKIELEGNSIANLQGKATYIPQTSSYLDPLIKVDKQISLSSNFLSEKTKGLYPFQCSGGMLRNALFDLVHENQDHNIIIADEPTPGMDTKTATNTLQILKNLTKHGRSVILITHDLDLAMSLSDRIAIFYEGTIIEIANANNFLCGTLQHAYSQSLFHSLPQHNFIPLRKQKTSTENPMCLVGTNLSFSYSNNKPLFEHINISISSTESVCLFAKSGFGKSTLAKIFSGYEVPHTGTVLFNNKPLPKKGFSPIQLIYQHPDKSVNPKWTIEKILSEGGPFDPKTLEKLRIPSNYLKRYPHELSGGELQRICIARALKPCTKFIIADEITTMLDPITQATIWHFLLEETQKRNIGLFVITHNPHLADKICTRVINLEELQNS